MKLSFKLCVSWANYFSCMLLQRAVFSIVTECADNNMAEKSLSEVDSTPLGMHMLLTDWMKWVEKNFLSFTATDEEDLPDITSELTAVAASWRNFGVQLGIRDSDLEVIQGGSGTPRDYLRQTLSTWLRRNYNTKRFGEPTWAKLVEALSNSAGGGNPHLAQQIARRHRGTCSGVANR